MSEKSYVIRFSSSISASFYQFLLQHFVDNKVAKLVNNWYFQIKISSWGKNKNTLYKKIPQKVFQLNAIPKDEKIATKCADSP